MDGQRGNVAVRYRKQQPELGAELLWETAELANAAADLDAALWPVAQTLARRLGWRVVDARCCRRAGPRPETAALGCSGRQVTVEVKRHGNPAAVLEFEAPVVALDGASSELLQRVVAQLECLAERTERNEQRLREHAERARIGRIASMGEIASSLAHELSQPLSAVMNYAGALRRLVDRSGRDVFEVVTMAERLSQQVARAGEVLQSLKQFVVRHSAERESLDLSSALRRIPLLLREQLEAQDIALEWQLAPDLPWVETNAAYVEQIVLNLLSNAIDALVATQGARSVRIAADRYGCGVRVTVADNGEGVPSELQARIFDAFYSTRPGGIGMGLAVSRSLAEALSGKIWTEPNPGGGARFHLLLPLAAGTGRVAR